MCHFSEVVYACRLFSSHGLVFTVLCFNLVPWISPCLVKKNTLWSQIWIRLEARVFIGHFSRHWCNTDLTLVAIMAAEERRKQKEQIKILKQQVGLLCGCADWIFPFFSLSKCPDTHTPCEHCGKCWIVIFWSFKAYFSITIITCSTKLVVVTFCPAQLE